MKKLLILFIFLSTNVFAEINLTKIKDGLNSPWSLSIVNDGKYIITEKPGNIILFNEVKNTTKTIKHNLDVLEDGQGGLLDILFKDNIVWVSYTENRGNYKTSTSIARGNFNRGKIEFKNIF